MASAMALTAAQSHAEKVFLTSTVGAQNYIYVVTTESPGTLWPGVPANGIHVTGMQTNEELEAIDFRTATGELYGVGDSSRLYRLDVNLEATPPTASATALSAQPFTPTMAGSRFGMSFIPNTDRIRITSTDEENFQLNPFNGARTSATPLNPAANIVDIACSNDFAGADSTVTYGIDSVSDTLYTISGDNGGLQAVGPLGINISLASSIDFAGSTLYAAMETASPNALYTINTSTGAATLVGSIATTAILRGIAIQPEQMAVKKKSLKVTFTGNRDVISANGVVDVPSGFTAAGSSIFLRVGEVEKTFELDAAGKAKVGNDSFSFKVKTKNGITTGAIKFALKKGSFGEYLSPFGVVSGDVSATPLHIPISFTAGGHYFQSSPALTWSYSATTKSGGKAK
jgi:hypothetical protein